MQSRMIQKFARSPKYRILCVLKQHGALSVPDLMQVIPLSYMGIKQHCIELERDGYLTRKRKSEVSGRGRPEQLYDSTPSAEEFFPRHDTLLTQQIIFALKQLYGTSAPEKILYTIYQNLIQDYRKKIQSMLFEERLQDFIRLREKDGYLLGAAPPQDGTSWVITEFHSPISGLLQDFPILLKFELQTYQKVLHPNVEQIRHIPHPYRTAYGIPKDA